MNSDLVQLDQRISILLTMNQHQLQSLQLCFVLRMSNIIQLQLNYVIIDQRKLLAVSHSVLCEIQRK